MVFIAYFFKTFCFYFIQTPSSPLIQSYSSLPPLVLLLIFSLSNFICYFDRGILGGSLKILKNEPGYGLENDETRQVNIVFFEQEKRRKKNVSFR